MVACPSVQLSDVVMDDAVDANGIKWTVSWPIEGWDAPELRGAVSDRSGKDGVAVSGMHYGGRPIILAGTASWGSVDPAKYATAQEELAEASDTIDGAVLLTVNEATPKQASVRRAPGGKPRFSPLGPFVGMTFTVPLLARDPRKYAVTLTSVALADGVVNNPGKFRAPPTVTITGGVAGIVLQNTTDDSKQVVLDATGATFPLVVDFDRQTVTDNGVPADEMVQAGTRWWELLKGNNTIDVTGTTGGTIAFRAAWV